MKILERIIKGLMVALVLIAIFMIIPLPMRCHKTVDAAVISIEQGDIPVYSRGQAVCYGPLQNEFWVEKSWDMKFVRWMSQNEVYGGAQVVFHPMLAVDLTRDQLLVGSSHNIFTAKVISQVGVVDSPTGTRTQYTVEIISNIKGALSGNVVVEQEGGMSNGILSVIEDAFPFLEAGSTYLLATRYNEQANAYTMLAHKNAGKILSGDFTLNDTQTKDLSRNDPKVQAFEIAYADETLLKADIDHFNTRNSFQSLQPEQKVAAQARADIARAVLEADAVSQ